MPKLICNDCHAHITKWYEFIDRLQTANQILVDYVRTGIMKIERDKTSSEQSVEEEYRTDIEQKRKMRRRWGTITKEVKTKITAKKAGRAEKVMKRVRKVKRKKWAEDIDRESNKDSDVIDEDKKESKKMGIILQDSNHTNSSNDIPDDCYNCPNNDKINNKDRPRKPSKTTSKAHLEHLKQPDGNYKCDQCTKTLSSKYFFEHYRAHARDPHICPICSNQLATQKSLHVHIRTVHKSKETCPICQKKVARLDQHMTITHSDKKPFACEQCAAKFVYKAFLKQHIDRVHLKLPYGNRDPLLCMKCGKVLKSKRGYRLHLMVHKGDRPFKCEDCERSYCTVSHLHSHRMAVHSDARNYKCRVCDKRFKTSSVVRKHERTHAGVKSSQCTVCLTWLSSAAAVVAHLKTHGVEKIHEN